MIKRLALILVVLFMATIQLTFTACDSAQSRAKRIVSLRFERKQMLDKLYQEYGGSELSQTVTSGLQPGKGSGSSTENQIIQGIANFTQGADRSMFEQNIRTIGSGENLIAITDKSKQFYSNKDVIIQAKKIYQIEIELEQLDKTGN